MNPRIVLILACLFWAGNFAVGRVIADQIAPALLSFLRWAVALCVLLPFVFARRVEAMLLVRTHFRWFFLMSLSSAAYHAIFVYTALEFTTATNVALIMAGTPAMALLISALMHGERYGWFRIGVVALSFAGIVVLVWQRLSLPNAGDLLACVAMTAWAYYNVALRDSPVKIDGTTMTTIIAVLGVLIITPLLAVEVAFRGVPVLSGEVMLAVLYIGLFASGLSYVLWNRGVAAIGAIHAAQFMNLVPLFGVLIGTLVLDEPFTLRHCLAAVLIISGLVLSEYQRRGQPVNAAALTPTLSREREREAAR